MTKFLAVLGVVVLLGGLSVGWLLQPGHVPLLDANRTRLAETYLEGYASGITYAKTNGAGSQEVAAEQREEYGGVVDDYDPYVVISAFCIGLDKGGYSIRYQDCIDIMAERQYWPTYDGQVTASWNRAYPWPGGALVSVEDEGGRTGGREGFHRP